MTIREEEKEMLEEKRDGILARSGFHFDEKKHYPFRADGELL